MTDLHTVMLAVLVFGVLVVVQDRQIARLQRQIRRVAMMSSAIWVLAGLTTAQLDDILAGKGIKVPDDKQPPTAPLPKVGTMGFLS